MREEDLLGASAYPMANGAHHWIAQLCVALAVPLLAIGIALIPSRGIDAATQHRRTDVLDGNRATGLYSIDGGYGLSGPLYANLVARMEEH